MNKMHRQRLAAALLSFIFVPTTGFAQSCGVPLELKGKNGPLAARLFADGSIAVRAPLSVNPDGGLHSYTQGDHGFAYIANGLNLRKAQGGWLSCAVNTSNSVKCRAAFLQAEKQDFGPGTAQFCSFAVAVAPYRPGQSMTSCQSAGRYIIGGGLGRPKLGPQVSTVAGQPLQTYVSTTSIKHLVNGSPSYLDSESLPIAVTADTKLMSRLVLVRGSGLHPTVAILGDKGPAFGEGSIALHQQLRYGEVHPQLPGPIPTDHRCGPGESALKAPFVASPDPDAGACGKKRAPTGPADIRAKINIEHADFLILPITPPMARDVVQATLSTALLQQIAGQAGLSEADISARLACLK